MLPEAVMLRAQTEFLDWNNTGKSVMEINHRSDDFMSIAEHAGQTLREVLLIPDNYHVFF